MGATLLTEGPDITHAYPALKSDIIGKALQLSSACHEYHERLSVQATKNLPLYFDSRHTGEYA
jgi:hypothetical protein